MRILAILALVVGMFASCDNGTTSESDTWTTPTDFAQLDGIWKVSSTVTGTAKDFVEKVMDETWTSSMQNVLGNMKFTIHIDSTQTISSTLNTMAASVIETFIFSGGNINEIWPDLKKGFDDMQSQLPNGMTVNTYNDVKSVVFTITISPTPLSDNDILETLNGCKINQDGTKIKLDVTVPDATLAELPGIAFLFPNGFIMIKQ